jgi:hypothetical protein
MWYKAISSYKEAAMDDEDMQCALVNLAIDELGDEVIDAIRADEREMILEFIRSDEWIYEVGEDIANALEELQHYSEEEVH